MRMESECKSRWRQWERSCSQQLPHPRLNTNFLAHYLWPRRAKLFHSERCLQPDCAVGYLSAAGLAATVAYSNDPVQTSATAAV